MMTKKRKYKFLRGSSGLHGSDFQIKLLTLCLLRGLKRGSGFELSSENQVDAGIFDDVVYEEVGIGAILMQGKHKEDRNAEIRIHDLFDSTKSEFRLCQYLSSFSKIKGFPDLVRVRLVTNVKLFDSKEMEECLVPIDINTEDILYCSGPVKGYALTEKSRDRLRNQLPDVPEEDLAAFLEKFQLVCIPDTALDQEIHQVLKQLKLFDGSEVALTVDYIRRKVEQWYMKGSGEYLDSTDAKAYLCLWRSAKYARSFHEFNISFRRRNVVPGNRLVYTANKEFYILGLIKVYRQFFEEYKKEDAIMIVNPEDELSIQKDIVEAFVIPECLCLIVPFFGDTWSYGALRINDLLQRIFARTYKTVVLLVDEEFSESVPEAQVIPLRTSFDDLDETCRNRFLDAAVEFQGKSVTLRNALAPNGDANEILDEQVLLRLSRGEKLKVEKRHEDEGIGSIYIGREFIRDEMKISERDLCDLIVSENDEKFVLISDSAGMGKTTVLTKIAEILQGPPYPHRWIVRLDLNRYANLFRRLREAGRESIEMEDVLDSTNPVLSNFERKLLNVADKVVLIADAVDEVNVAYTGMVLKFLENCFARTSIAKIVVTTRPQLENLLERELSVNSFKLELFSQEDQIDFLAEYWRTKLDLKEEDCQRCEWYARCLMQKLNSSIGHASWSFIGIPLQTKMIGDIFQQGGGQKGFEWRGCREFLRSQIAYVELIADINVAKLYEMFVAKKGDIYVDKKCRDGAAYELLNEHYRRSLQVHKKLALESLIDPEKCQLFGVCRNADASAEDALPAMGIVQRIEDTWIFSHQTFAEYFMATCLWDELASGSAAHQFLQFLLGHVFVSAEFSVVRSFFENILANESVPEIILEACASIVSQIPWNESKNVVRLAEEGRLNTLRLILEKSTSHSYLLQIEDVSGTTALHAATKYPPVVEYLVGKGADVNRKTFVGQTVLHEAVLNDVLDVVTFLTASDVEIDAKLRDGRTPLHLAAEKDFCDVARLLIRARADKEAREQNQKTPLHLAVENNSVRVAKLLVEEGADLGAETKNGRTAMDLALKIKSAKMVKLLKSHSNR